MLAVAIHHNHGIAPGVFEPGAKGQLLAKVPAKSKAMEIRHRLGLLGHDLPGLIRRTVINHHKLVAATSPGQFARYTGQERPQVTRFLIERDNYRDKRRAFGFHGLVLGVAQMAMLFPSGRKANSALFGRQVDRLDAIGKGANNVELSFE